MKHRCPVCSKTVRAPAEVESGQEEFFPFCSERCRLIDLGAWLDAEYKIVSNAHSEESDEPSRTSSVPAGRQ